jgi:uncharacterized protein (DUF983 family)
MQTMAPAPTDHDHTPIAQHAPLDEDAPLTRRARRAAEAAAAPPLPGFLGLLGRGALLRCPRCGQGGLRKGWFALKERCPGCQLALERGESEDYWLGAYAINLVIAEFVALLIVVGFILATLPAVPWGAVVWVGLAAALLSPIAFFPLSRTLWLALDLYARPNERGDRLRRRPVVLPDERPRA